VLSYCVKSLLFALLPALIVFPAALLSADDKPLVATDPLTDVAPLPALAEFAAAHHIPTSGIALADAGAKPQKGDAVTLLVTLFDGSSERQWLARIEADDLTENERQLKPLSEGVMYSGTGQTWRYPISRTALNVFFIGPFSPSTARGSIPVEIRRRVLTNPEYLSYGLDQYCQAEMRYRQAVRDAGIKNAWITASSNPLSAETVRMGQHVAALINFTPEEDRIRTGGCFPVVSFVDVATKVPAFEAVLRHVLDMPSIWSIVRHLGISGNWDYRDFVRVSTPGAGVESSTYRFGLRLNMNEQFSIKSAFTVTAPRPPLQVCAGILGVYAERPSDASQRLFIQMVAAQPASNVTPVGEHGDL
jgi:hypothetical protein